MPKILMVPRIIQQTSQDDLDEIKEANPRNIFGIAPLTRRWNKAVGAAFHAGRLDMKELTEKIDLVPVDSISGRLYVSKVPMSKPTDFWFACVWPGIEKVCGRGLSRFRREDAPIEYARKRQCLKDGITEFWFCLGLLADQGLLSSWNAPADNAFLLGGVLRWWNEICKLGERVVGTPGREQWRSWGRNATGWCFHMGMPEAEWKSLLEEPDGEAAGQRMLELKQRFDQGELQPPTWD